MTPPLSGWVEVAHHLARWCLAATFGLAAVGKLAGFSHLRHTLAQSLPWLGRSAGVAGGVLVVFEVALAGWLATSFERAGALAAAALVLAGFTAFLGWTVWRGARLVCSCFGASTQPVSLVDVGRNGLLLAVAALGLGTLRAGASLELDGAASAAVGALGLVLFLLLTSLRELAAVVRLGARA